VRLQCARMSREKISERGLTPLESYPTLLASNIALWQVTSNNERKDWQNRLSKMPVECNLLMCAHLLQSLHPTHHASLKGCKKVFLLQLLKVENFFDREDFSLFCVNWVAVSCCKHVTDTSCSWIAPSSINMSPHPPCCSWNFLSCVQTSVRRFLRGNTQGTTMSVSCTTPVILLSFACATPRLSMLCQANALNAKCEALNKMAWQRWQNIDVFWMKHDKWLVFTAKLTGFQMKCKWFVGSILAHFVLLSMQNDCDNWPVRCDPLDWSLRFDSHMLHCAKSYRPFELFVNENCKL